MKDISMKKKAEISVNILRLVREALWGNGEELLTITQEEYEELEKHAILLLLTPAIKKSQLLPELKKAWKTYSIEQINHNLRTDYAQSNLPLQIPYVILKGTAAAQYYPHPEFRTMGDIDIMTRREDLKTACQQMLDNDYHITKELNREICFVKNGTAVELHRRFATLNDPEKAKCLDDLIIENINPTHQLPDPINGLVILEHISQHMEGGLGLRQIIDWMMFVDKCLSDEKWPAFQELAERIGLEKLAIVTTRMCEIYLGLPQREWCAGADAALCRQLMDYVLLCGNFGNKKTSATDVSENAFAYASTPKAAFRLLQKQGLANWELAKKHRILQPLAWIYQAFRYASRGLKREKAVSKLKAEYSAGKKRKDMFNALGVKTVAKGDIVFKDGQYVKK